MLVGFGLVGGALTILAVATPISLSGLMTALAAVRSFETNTRACARARGGGTHSNPVEINGPEWAADPELKPEERAGGWDPASLATYRRERERAAARRTVGADELVGGLVVTEFERPRPRRPVLEGSGMNSKHYSPWRWGGR